MKVVTNRLSATIYEMKTTDDYWKFAESEGHFNETHAGIRNHAATWMLASFSAIAMQLRSELTIGAKHLARDGVNLTKDGRKHGWANRIPTRS